MNVKIEGFKRGKLPRHGQVIIFLSVENDYIGTSVRFEIGKVEKSIIAYDENGDETGGTFTWRPRGSKRANRCGKNDKVHTMVVDGYDRQFQITTKTLWCDYNVFVTKYKDVYL